MKNGQIELNCRNDTDTFLEDEILLNTTSNGLYAIPITAAKQLLEKTDCQSPHHHIVLRTTEEKSNRELAKKTPQAICKSHYLQTVSLNQQI